MSQLSVTACHNMSQSLMITIHFRTQIGLCFFRAKNNRNTKDGNDVEMSGDHFNVGFKFWLIKVFQYTTKHILQSLKRLILLHNFLSCKCFQFFGRLLL